MLNRYYRYRIMSSFLYIRKIFFLDTQDPRTYILLDQKSPFPTEVNDMAYVELQ